MPTSDLYASTEDAKAYLAGEDQRSLNDVKIRDALDQASRAIDSFCGRIFYQLIDSDDTATARTYHPVNGCVTTDDFWTTTGLVVKTDTGDDGTYETTVTDYQLEPLNGVVDGLIGWPYYRLRQMDTYWPTGNRRPSVQVTARWGWESVPSPVKQSTLHLASSLFKLADAPFGIMGVGDFGGIRAPVNTLRYVETLLQPYRKAQNTNPIGSA